ncbi:hypothetical protein PG989_012301 [Apiospora arundinis]
MRDYAKKEYQLFTLTYLKMNDPKPALLIGLYPHGPCSFQLQSMPATKKEVTAWFRRDNDTIRVRLETLDDFIDSYKSRVPAPLKYKPVEVELSTAADKVLSLPTFDLVETDFQRRLNEKCVETIRTLDMMPYFWSWAMFKGYTRT